MKYFDFMKHILLVCASVLMISLAACGGKTETEKPAEVAEQNTQLEEALLSHNLSSASALADSMSLYVDDLTPEETVSVLMAFLEVHNQAVKDKERKRDLETIRKFIDVYDIALGINPNDMRAAIDKANRINAAVNLDSLAADFRARLTEYDAVRGGNLDAPAPADTTSAQTDSVAPVAEGETKDIPLELRPAE